MRFMRPTLRASHAMAKSVRGHVTCDGIPGRQPARSPSCCRGSHSLTPWKSATLSFVSAQDLKS